MQNTDRRPPAGVAFDSSVEDSIDQVLALAMLYAYSSRRDIRLASVSISRHNLKIAAFCDTVGRFFGVNLPVGMFEKGPARSEVPSMLSSVLSRTSEDGSPLYPRVIETFTHTADPVAAIRNALTAQQDQNAVVILAGPPTNLLGMLALPGNAQLVQQKVRSLVVAAPQHDTAGFAELMAKWPGPVVLAPEELNQTLPLPAGSLEQDFSWATNHPLVDAYRAAGKMPYEVPVAAMAAVLHAVFPNEPYFSVSDPGVLTIERGQPQFTPSAQGKHRQLSADPQQKDKVLQTFREVISTKPPEPRGRGGRGPQP